MTEERFIVPKKKYDELISRYCERKKEIEEQIAYWCKKFNQNPQEAEEHEYKFSIAEIGEVVFVEDIKPKGKEGEEILNRLRSPDLLEQIKTEIDKDHIEDDNLKMTLFLIEVSSLLANPKLRTSMQVTGNTAEGKDNALRATSKHLPQGSFLFITSGTQATLEDDVKDKRLIIISEVNLFKKGGANQGLLEVIKQRTEGGTSAIKKDIRSDNKVLRHEEAEQGSVIFGTTDAEQDEELGTRLMKGTIRATPKRIKKVNDNTLDNFSNKELILKKLNQKDSWIKKALTYFYKQPQQYQIVIPYAKFLKGKIDGQYIFDNKNARSQRDIKRLLALTCATTWLFQEQREVEVVEGTKFLISKIEDLVNTLKYSNEFFNQSYSGMDSRITDALKFVESKGKEVWVDRFDIQEFLNIKDRRTISGYLWTLEQQGFLERKKGNDLNEELKFGGEACINRVKSVESFGKPYKSNHIYYKSVYKPCNKRVISVELSKLKDYLEQKACNKSVECTEIMEEIGQKPPKRRKTSTFLPQITRFGLHASSTFPIDFSKTGIKEDLENE